MHPNPCKKSQSCRVSTPTAHVLSAVTLPDPIRQVVSAWDRKDLSVEHAGSKLFLKLLQKVEGHLDLMTAMGGHYRLYLVPAPLGAEFDSHVTLLSRGRGEGVKRPGRSASGALELARAMRLGKIPPGVSVRSGQGKGVLSTERLEARLLFVYEETRLRGYVLSLSNKSRKNSALVDVTRFTPARLVLIGARDLVLGPGEATRLYLVFWK